jgi:hypothetical protein
VPDADGIGMGGEHDWDRPGRLPCGLNHGRGLRKDDIDLEANQIGCELRQLLYRFREAEFDRNIPALDMAEVP